jgi:hypothetical protein
MNNQFPAVSFHDFSDNGTPRDNLLSSPNEPFSTNWLFRTMSRLWNGRETPKTEQTPACTACEVDFGCGASGECRAELLDVSPTGCVARLPLTVDAVGHVYDIAAVTLTTPQGEALRLYGTIVCIEADHEWQHDASILATFKFTALDENNRARLGGYIDRFSQEPANHRGGDR